MTQTNVLQLIGIPSKVAAMQESDWHDGSKQFLMYSLQDTQLNTALLIILNASDVAVKCQLPALDGDLRWRLALSSVAQAELKNKEQFEVCCTKQLGFYRQFRGSRTWLITVNKYVLQKAGKMPL